MADDGLTADGKRIFRELGKLADMLVMVGFQQGQKAEKSGVDICDVAAFNELGTIHIPSRPFLSMSVTDNEDKIAAFMQAKVQEVINGKSAERVLKEIGVFQKGLVQDTITDGEFEPNAPSTIRRKKSSHPLIDTGTMRQSVNFVIREKE